MKQLWRAAPDSAPLRWKRWGEACFAYHPASGQTHFLNELAAWILAYLADSTASSVEVAAAIATAHDGARTSELDVAVEATLKTLAGLGLVERVPAP